MAAVSGNIAINVRGQTLPVWQEADCPSNGPSARTVVTKVSPLLTDAAFRFPSPANGQIHCEIVKALALKAVRFLRLLFSTAPADKLRLWERLQQMPLLGPFVTWCIQQKARIVQRSPEDYVKMQKRTYEMLASIGEASAGDVQQDYVVGTLHEHDTWPDYEEYLMKYVPRDASWVALDYGCGPGRNLRRWTDWFRRIDGVDISQRNLDNAQVFIRDKVAPEKWPNLYITSGMDCGDAPRNSYDFAFSTICLQHICVHSVRSSIFSSMFHCLKPGGRLSIQMGFGVPSPYSVPYREDFVQATMTNRGCDVAISSPDEVRQDLEQIGFEKFEYWLRPVGPGDLHPQWIFFTAIRPRE